MRWRASAVLELPLAASELIPVFDRHGVRFIVDKDRAVLPVLLETLRLQKLKG